MTGIASAYDLSQVRALTTQFALRTNTTDSTTSVDIVAKHVSSFTENQFMSLFLEKDEVTFPPYTKIVITNVSRTLLYKAAKNTSARTVCDVINDILMPISKKIHSIRSEDEEAYIKTVIDSPKRCLSFVATNELKFCAQKTDITAKVRALLERLSRSNLEVLHIKPNQQLNIKLSSQKKDDILENKNEMLSKIHELFLSYLPEECESVNIDLNGRAGRIIPNVKNPDGTEFKGIAIACDQGFSITLKKRVQLPA